MIQISSLRRNNCPLYLVSRYTNNRVFVLVPRFCYDTTGQTGVFWGVTFCGRWTCRSRSSSWLTSFSSNFKLSTERMLNSCNRNFRAGMQRVGLSVYSTLSYDSNSYISSRVRASRSSMVTVLSEWHFFAYLTNFVPPLVFNVLLCLMGKMMLDVVASLSSSIVVSVQRSNIYFKIWSSQCPDSPIVLWSNKDEQQAMA